MNNNTKRNIKNVANTGGKWLLKGVKFAGKGTLTVTELASKGVTKVAESDKARSVLSKAGTVVASVAFAPATISITALNYLIQNNLLNNEMSAANAIKSTFKTTDEILKNILDVTAIPTAAIAKETEKLSKKGKEALDR